MVCLSSLKTVLETLKANRNIDFILTVYLRAVKHSYTALSYHVPQCQWLQLWLWLLAGVCVCHWSYVFFYTMCYALLFFPCWMTLGARLYVYKLITSWQWYEVDRTISFHNLILHWCSWHFFVVCLCSCFVSMLVSCVFLASNMSLSGQTAARLKIP